MINGIYLTNYTVHHNVHVEQITNGNIVSFTFQIYEYNLWKIADLLILLNIIIIL